MNYVIPWSDGTEGLVMCAVSCGDQIKRREKLHIVGIYMTNITKMHGTMNIKHPVHYMSQFCTLKEHSEVTSDSCRTIRSLQTQCLRVE